MIRATILLAAAAATLSLSAAAEDVGDKLLQVKGTMDSINGELSSQRAEISRLKSDLQALSGENRKQNRQVLDELKALRRQNQSVLDTSSAIIKAGTGDQPASKELLKAAAEPRNYDLETPDGKMIFGGEEYVYVQQANATLAARVDTGASVSSITATNISRFESNGVKMVRFTIEANGRAIDCEAPFLRTTRVRQSSSDDFSYRLVVGLNIKIGSYSAYTEFNLQDRTRMDFPMLLGRSLLTDIAAVDVSRNYVQQRADPDGLVLINRDLFVLLQRNGVDPNKEYDERQKLLEGGQIATPDSDYGTNLGTSAPEALPEVTQRALRDEYMQRFTDAGLPLPEDEQARRAREGAHGKEGAAPSGSKAAIPAPGDEDKAASPNEQAAKPEKDAEPKEAED